MDELPHWDDGVKSQRTEHVRRRKGTVNQRAQFRAETWGECRGIKYTSLDVIKKPVHFPKNHWKLRF